MMCVFLTANRMELINRCRVKVAQRVAPEANAAELEHGIGLFLDQLIETLRVDPTGDPSRSRQISGSAGGGDVPESSEITESAARHGHELLRHGFTVDQVVHDYGDLCQSITDLAFERKEPFEADEFRTLNRCLDNAMAGAVTEFGRQRDIFVADAQTDALNKRLGSFAHELRNLLNTATLALHAIRGGDVGIAGATGAVLDRSLVGMRHLIDRSLSEVRMSAGMPLQHRLFSLADFIAEAKLSASLEAVNRKCVLLATTVDPGLALLADRDLLAAALGNLLQNAIKFTHRFSEIMLRAYAENDRILIEVEDHCGGLPPGGADRLFRPFTQAGADRSGLGLGLSIARRSVEVNQGTLRVRDLPGSGCVFTMDLPRHALPGITGSR